MLSIGGSYAVGRSKGFNKAFSKTEAVNAEFANMNICK